MAENRPATPGEDVATFAPEWALEIRNVTKRFDEVYALRDATLSIRANEFFTLLGPSGCGKTTLLRLVAGFEELDRGEILLHGEAIGHLPPNRRPINTVFQHYALFPHMTVRDNVAFGMERLGWSADEIAARTRRMLELVRLSELGARYPSQLSGGQQQRVALARAMGPRPRVLLLDEPLSALDLKLRQSMRTELKQIQQDTGITFVFVTHDQEEALTMSDRIAVMSAGEIQQVGTPREVYESPLNRFVADFIGETNLLPATVTATSDGRGACRIADGTELPCEAAAALAVDTTVSILMRPEHLALVAANSGAADLAGSLQRSVYLGTDMQHVVALRDGTEIRVRAQNAEVVAAPEATGRPVGIAVAAGAVKLVAD